jgi:hypothetical protein
LVTLLVGKAGSSDMRFQVFGDYLLQKAIHGPSDSGDEMQHRRAIRLFAERAFHSRDLAADTADAGD